MFCSLNVWIGFDEKLAFSGRGFAAMRVGRLFV